MSPKKLLVAATDATSAQIRDQIDLSLFLSMLVVSLASAFFVAWLYRYFYERRGTGSQIHRAFPLLALATTALFVGVQVSIPLSLGLLGSLSFIRFRTPVKEPEEVGFLMLVIASSICSATHNFQFVAFLMIFAVIAVILQRGAAALRWARRDGLLVLTLSNEEAASKSAAVETALTAGLSSHRLETSTSRNGMTTWQYVFTGLRGDAATLQTTLSGVASFTAVDVFLDRPGGIR